MNTSESIVEISKALFQVHRDMPSLRLSTKNDFLKTSYANLEQVITKSKLILQANNLIVLQLPAGTGAIGLSTRIIHVTSGEWIEETITYPLGPSKGISDAQVGGAAITYLRRYALVSLLFSYGEKDTDGNRPPEQKKSEKKKEEGATPKSMVLTLVTNHAILEGLIKSADDELGKRQIREKILSQEPFKSALANVKNDDVPGLAKRINEEVTKLKPAK